MKFCLIDIFLVSGKCVYGVRNGKSQSNVYKNWKTCLAAIKECKEASYQKFETKEDALLYAGGMSTKEILDRKKKKYLKSLEKSQPVDALFIQKIN
jgi:viroplasmin and RNaseH domain-containing protein